MPLSDANVVHANSGAFDGVSGTASLVGTDTTTLGSAILLAAAGPYVSFDPPPAGFTELLNVGGGTAGRLVVWIAFDAVGGQTSWTLTCADATGQPVSWVVQELSGIDPDNPLNAFALNVSNSEPSADFSSGMTSANSASDTIAVTFHARTRVGSPGPTWTGHTNSFVESHDQASNGFDSVGLSVARRFPGATGTFEATATSSTTGGKVMAGIVVLEGLGSPLTDPVIALEGWEVGTDAGNTVGVAGQRMWDGAVGTATVQAGSAHSGTYGCRLATTAAVASRAWTVSTIGSARDTEVRAIWIRPVSGSGTPDVAGVTTGVGAGLGLLYDYTNQKFGIHVGNGTQWQAGTATLNQWHLVEFIFSGATSTIRHADWSIDGVDQTPPPDSTTSVSAIAEVFIGWGTNQTQTVDYDDWVLSVTAGDYPLTDHKVLLLRADAAGTLAVTGSTANFATFSANATITAWNATTARTAIRDLPPNLTTGTADGIAQITPGAGTQYVQVPMETYTLTGAEAIAAVRAMFPGWGVGNAPVAANLGLRAFTDAEVTLLAAANGNHGFGNNNTTAPAWVAKMVDPLGGWTQARLDALVFRIGFSSDATPDIGVHGVYAQVAVRLVPPAVDLAASGQTASGGAVALKFALAVGAQGQTVSQGTATLTVSGGTTVLAATGQTASGGTVDLTRTGPTGAPTAISQQTNLTGDLAALWSPPGTPDPLWLTTIDSAMPVLLLAEFDTPAIPPGSGGPTGFQVEVRKTVVAGAPDPQVWVEVWEAGAYRATVAAGVTVTSDTMQVVSGTFNPAVLTDPTGAGVQLRVYSHGPDPWDDNWSDLW